MDSRYYLVIGIILLSIFAGIIAYKRHKQTDENFSIVKLGHSLMNRGKHD